MCQKVTWICDWCGKDSEKNPQAAIVRCEIRVPTESAAGQFGGDLCKTCRQKIFKDLTDLKKTIKG